MYQGKRLLPWASSCSLGSQLGCSRGSQKQAHQVRFHLGCVLPGLMPENNYQLPLSREGGGNTVVGEEGTVFSMCKSC